jgi:hypothetical protein
MPVFTTSGSPTTIDRFFGVVQICQNIATMQNNMRDNVVFLQNQFTSGGITGTSTLQGDLVGTQTAYRALGAAFQNRLTANQNVLSAWPTQLAAGASAIGVTSSDVTGRQQLLVNVSSGLATAVFTSSSDVITGTNQVLNTVPVAMLAF